MVDLRLSILESIKPIVTQAIEVLAWGQTVYVGVMPSEDKDAFDMSMLKEVNGKKIVSTENFSAKLVCKTVYNAEGNPVFSDVDVAQIGRMPAVVLEPIVELARKLNGMSESSIVDEAKN